MFRRSSSNSKPEWQQRQKHDGAQLPFGVSYLDDALRGIYKDDLILVGAGSGVGKTQFCCNVALANVEAGYRVHYIALEASEFEIERRLKYPLIMNNFYSDPTRPRLGYTLNYPDWYSGKYATILKIYEDKVAQDYEDKFQNLHTYYKFGNFGIDQLIEAVCTCASESDLIIIDHVHYFDFDDDNEHRAIREIAKTVRTLALEKRKPIILVAHLRKSDKFNQDLVAGLEEFHGSSDLYKIATKVITIAPGRTTPAGNYETFFRIPKNRFDGGVTRYVAREVFSPRDGRYEKGKYELTWSDQKKSDGFEMLDTSLYPSWARKRPANEFSETKAAPASDGGNIRFEI